jgi:hypothetical protein
MPTPTCAWYDIACPYLNAGNSAVHSATSSATNAAWSSICQSFVDAASTLFQEFGTAFTSIPDLNLHKAGLRAPYGIAEIIGSVVAALLILLQVARTLWTRDGTGIAQAVTGVAKTVLAWLLTASVATAALAASDDVSRFIVQATFGSTTALAAKLGSTVNWFRNDGAQSLGGAALLLVMALVGMVLVLILWFELLMRNVALAVLIAVSPISAAGQVSDTTRIWWSRTVAAAVQLILLKPVIAIVFAVGFAMVGNSAGTPAVLQGMLVLGLAAFAWPAVARFFTFSTVQPGNGGLSVALGFAAGALASRGTAGVHPAEFSRAAESRTASGGGSRGSLVLGVAGWGLRQANQTGTALATRMEQTAGQAGMQPHSIPATTGGTRPNPLIRPEGEA